MRSTTVVGPADTRQALGATRPGALARLTSRITTHPLIALATIVCGSFAARLTAALAHSTPQYFQDEYVYAALSRSIAHGRLTIRGGSSGFPAVVEPLLAAVTWLPGDPELAYRLTQGIHVLAMSLAAVPVYYLARRLMLPVRDGLLAAAATVALPSFVFSAYVTADAVGLTIALCAILAGVVALERPTARTQALFLTLAFAATLTRLQYVFLPVAFLVGALVVEQGRIRVAARAFRPTLLALAALVALAVLAGPGRLVGLYDGIFEFNVDAMTIGHWVAVEAFLLSLASGVVVLPGAIGGLIGALGSRAGRAERGFASIAVVSLLALLVQAALFSANGDRRFLERYLTLAGPLLILGLCLVARSRRGRIVGMAAGGVLLVAVMRIPLTGYTAGSGKTDSPLLGAAHWIENRLGTAEGARLAATGAAVLILCSIVLLRVSTRAVPIILGVAIVAGAAVSFAGTSYDVARADAARNSFLPSDPRWVDHAGLGPATMLVTKGTDPPVASTHLFWNTSLDRVARLDGAAPIDAFASSGAAIAGDGTVVADGVPVTGPVLIEEYATAVQLEQARLVERTKGTSLWAPASQARVATLTEGLYLDGWLTYDARIRTWPGPTGGTSTLRFTLSLPERAPTQKIVLTGSGVHRTVLVRSGGSADVTLRIDRSMRTELKVTCPRALQVEGDRFVCAQATVPEFRSPISVSS